YVVMLLVAFTGMASSVLSVVQGEPTTPAPRAEVRDDFGTIAPIVLFLSMSLLLGVYVPGELASMLHAAAAALGGR
ncbi:hydrogenase, partial [Myxococcota bacterium]|nr:hydrogenase [Myxococcota bacterium]